MAHPPRSPCKGLFALRFSSACWSVLPSTQPRTLRRRRRRRRRRRGWPQAFRYIVKRYFSQPNYYRVPTVLTNGSVADCCFFSFYQPECAAAAAVAAATGGPLEKYVPRRADLLLENHFPPRADMLRSSCPRPASRKRCTCPC